MATSTEATRLALATITALGITAVGCEAPREEPAPPTFAHEAPEVVPAQVGHDAREPARDAGSDASSAPATARVDHFFGEADAPHLSALREAEITRIERGSGGRSVAFRFTFADGSRGYFKPDQSFSGTSDVAELAAYHLDRLLGLGRVPPTVMRVVPYARLAPLLAGDPRAAEVRVRPDATVRGSLSRWVETPLVPLVLGIGFERWVRVEPPPYLTPFQRPRVYIAQASGEAPIAPPTDEAGVALPVAQEPDTPTRAAELSDLVLFDHLVNNIDRWGGGFTNVRTLGRAGPLVFLDQGGAFPPGMQDIGFMRRRLAVVQRFRRETIEAIRGLDVAALEQRLLAEGEGALLDAPRWEGLEARRRAILVHVEERLAQQGESATFAW